MLNDSGEIWAKSSEDQKVEVTHSQKDSLISIMKMFIKDDRTRSKRSKKKGNSKVAKMEDPTPVPSMPPKKAKKVWCKKKKTSSPLLLL